MKVAQAQLARRLALPAGSHTNPRFGPASPARRLSTRSEPRPRQSTAPLSPLSPPSFDLATFRSCGDAELRSLMMSTLGRAEREAVAEQIEHRTWMAHRFPQAAKNLGYPKPPADITRRHDGPIENSHFSS